MSASVVPARAGMSPADSLFSSEELGGPRASGDEPITCPQGAEAMKWSPRERG